MSKGQIIILNGAPRAGKTSIAKEIQDTYAGTWFNIGVDAYVKQLTPQKYLPGIGLRPGGERPELEAFVATSYTALYHTIAAHSRLGLNVVVDAGHHNDYARPLAVYGKLAELMTGFPVFLAGVQCPVEAIMQRRNQSAQRHGEPYLTAPLGAPVPEPVLRWQDAVHRHMVYDLVADTSRLTAAECAERIRASFDPGHSYPGLQQSFRQLHDVYLSRLQAG